MWWVNYMVHISIYFYQGYDVLLYDYNLSDVRLSLICFPMQLTAKKLCVIYPSPRKQEQN